MSGSNLVSWLLKKVFKLGLFMQGYSSYEKLIKELIKLVTNQDSGALIGVVEIEATQEKAYVYIYVEMGRIVAAKHGRFSGFNALHEIKTIEAIKFGFHPYKIPENYDDLPDTVKVINFLKEGMDVDAENVDAIAHKHDINEQTLDDIQKAFLVIVGPIGDVIFDRELKKSKAKNELIENLAKTLKFPEDKEAFFSAIE